MANALNVWLLGAIYDHVRHALTAVTMGSSDDAVIAIQKVVGEDLAFTTGLTYPKWASLELKTYLVRTAFTIPAGTATRSPPRPFSVCLEFGLGDCGLLDSGWPRPLGHGGSTA